MNLASNQAKYERLLDDFDFQSMRDVFAARFDRGPELRRIRLEDLAAGVLG